MVGVDLTSEGRKVELPAELRRWNWGAFFLSWIWGVGNGTFIALLALIPFVGLVMAFVLGVKGNAWAWRNRHWDDVAHFRRVQRRWAFAGLAFWVSVPIVLGGFVFLILLTLRHSEPYTMAFDRMSDNAEVASVLGRPLSTGWPMGTLSTSGANGEAALFFSVEGPKAKGRAFVQATKSGGRWRLKTGRIVVDGRDLPINFLQDLRARFAPSRTWLAAYD